MRKLVITGIMALAVFVPLAYADDGLIVKKCSHSAAETLDRLEAALKKKGITVATRWNHAAAAKKHGLFLHPTELLIFGNPKLGTPLMQSNRKVGIDLPMKVLAWEDAKGQTWLAYTNPQSLANKHDVRDRDEVIKKMTGALAGLTAKACRP